MKGMISVSPDSCIFSYKGKRCIPHFGIAGFPYLTIIFGCSPLPAPVPCPVPSPRYFSSGRKERRGTRLNKGPARLRRSFQPLSPQSGGGALTLQPDPAPPLPRFPSGHSGRPSPHAHQAPRARPRAGARGGTEVPRDQTLGAALSAQQRRVAANPCPSEAGLALQPGHRTRRRVSAHLPGPPSPRLSRLRPPGHLQSRQPQ